MRAPSDLPRPRRVPRGRPAIVVTVLVLFVVLTSLRGTAGFWTDYLWFDQLGFGNVFTGILSAKFTLAIVFSAAAFVLLLVNLVVADRIAPRLSLAPQDEVVQRYREAVGTHTGAVRLVVALIFGAILGIGQASQWNLWLLFHNAQNFGAKDPQFHRDIGFYVFKLPFEQNLVSWAFGAVLVVTFITALFHYLNGGIRLQTPGPSPRVTPQVKAHLSLLLGVLALIKGAGYYLQQYSLVLSTRGRVKGALYTDVHAQLPAFKLLMFISLIAFVLLIANIYLRGWTLPALGVGLWFLVSIAAGAIYPAIIQRYTVKPVENRKEATFIQRNIDSTRAALNMTKVTDKPFAADANLTPQALQDNTQTVRNIRLWDPNPAITPATYSQLQAIRGYYQFFDVNVDRYQLGGQLTQTEMSVRELNQNALPGGRSWVNEHLQYTHGFGAVLAPANAVTVDGQPQFDIRDIPPTTASGPADTPQISQPRVYFGQQTTNFSIVGTKNDELDYESQTTAAPVTSHYDGKGGVLLSSLVRKAAFALRFSDLNVLISGSITPKSRILYVRDVADRIHKAAPFLKLDADPYAVITGPPNAQRIQWVADLYTTTDQYPYAEDFSEPGRLDARSGLNTPFNYVRNSVKATVDAYDGTVTFYAFDSTDPILSAYRHAFPKMFKDGSQISPELRAHLRFPEDLFRVQTSMWGRYHITDAAAFYQAGDAWDVAADPGVGVGTTATSSAPVVGPNGRLVVPSARRQDPFYLLMKLPTEGSESFLMLQPMVAAAASQQGQQNLTAFMVAKSDPAEYGQIEVFHMPEGQRVPGPTQIDSQIQQDPTVSKDISLLNTNGSEVLFGNILTIPVNQSLLYVRPLYVSSKGQGASIPQLKKVIVVYNNQVAYQNTLQESLDQLFPGATKLTQEQSGRTTPTGPTTTTPPPGTTPSTTIPGATQTVAQLLAQAQNDFADANKALASNPPDFATYSQKIQAAEALIAQAAQLAAAASGSPAPTTTAPPPSTTSTTKAA